jgi:ElaA protein
VTDGAHDLRFGELNTGELVEILRLRIDVFVVEQGCPYPEIDGRDDEPATRHVWIDDSAGRPAAYLRLLDDDDVRRIGRVVTRPSSRGEGLAGRLVHHALATSEGPWVLDAQSHLARWYESFGFVQDGAEFLEDGISHVPMRRKAAGR